MSALNESPDSNIEFTAVAATAKPGEVTPTAPSPPAPPARYPATVKEKVALLVALIVITAIALWLAQKSVAQVDTFIQRVNRVQWQAPAALTLKPGPPTFWYDDANHQLVHIGVIDEKKKFDLVALILAPAEQPVSEEIKSYWAAIDHLTFVSNDQLGGLLISLLSLGGLAGVLGVQLRSLVNYVGHACYANNLDVVIWWPYYFVRPFIGLLLGIVVVIIVHAGFLVTGEGAPSGTLWWASVAFLSGFGEQEFTQRLRQLAKTLFGEKT